MAQESGSTVEGSTPWSSIPLHFHMEMGREDRSTRRCRSRKLAQESGDSGTLSSSLPAPERLPHTEGGLALSWASEQGEEKCLEDTWRPISGYWRDMDWKAWHQLKGHLVLQTSPSSLAKMSLPWETRTLVTLPDPYISLATQCYSKLVFKSSLCTRLHFKA